MIKITQDDGVAVMKQVILHLDKETQNTFRWTKKVGDADFHLYIPRKTAPACPPKQITVWISTSSDELSSKEVDVRATVIFASEHSLTIHYRPEGNSDSWEIGEPYIPSGFLSQPWPERLYIGVIWESEN